METNVKFYLAARFSRKYEMQEHIKYLVSIGHEVTSSWPYEENASTDSFLETATDLDVTLMALRDIQEVDAADALIYFGEQPRVSTRGGRNVELGYAIGRGKLIYHVGPREHIFHWLPDIQYIDALEDIVNQLIF